VNTTPVTSSSDGSPEFVGPGSADALKVVNNILDGFSTVGGKGTFALGETLNILGNEYNMQAVFTALEQRNVVEILANPRVTTLNNVPANIKIVEKIPYAEAVSGPSQGTTTQEIEFEEAGVDITAKPIITPNGFVRLEIKLEQRIFRERVGTDPLDPPAIDVRDANTNVIVPDRNTVVLGGLRQIRQLEAIDGVPWFHRIPVIGWLFKNKSYDRSKIELLLMMTPTIIKEEIKMTEKEKYWYDKIDTDWHLPDYFFDDTKSATDKPDIDK
jgi:type II secretory pathway component GspD/PulD (secretin)